MNKQLQLTASKNNSNHDLVFTRNGEKVAVNNCTKDELIMIKKVIEKLIK